MPTNLPDKPLELNRAQLAVGLISSAILAPYAAIMGYYILYLEQFPSLWFRAALPAWAMVGVLFLGEKRCKDLLLPYMQRGRGGAWILAGFNLVGWPYALWAMRKGLWGCRWDSAAPQSSGPDPGGQ